jgi:hypothetical protein
MEGGGRKTDDGRWMGENGGGDKERGALVEEHPLLWAIEGHLQLIQDIAAQDPFFSTGDGLDQRSVRCPIDLSVATIDQRGYAGPQHAPGETQQVGRTKEVNGRTVFFWQSGKVSSSVRDNVGIELTGDSAVVGEDNLGLRRSEGLVSRVIGEFPADSEDEAIFLTYLGDVSVAAKASYFVGHIEQIVATGDHSSALNGNPFSPVLFQKLLSHPPVELLVFDEIPVEAFFLSQR